MAKAASNPVTPELVESWRARIRELDGLIAGDPLNQWCWLWQIRRDILAHLMHRYAGGTIKATVPSPTGQARPGPASPDATTDAYIRAASTIQQAHVGVNPPREGAQLRGRLASLQSVNTSRYAHDPRPVIGNRTIGITRRGQDPRFSAKPLQYRARFTHAIPTVLLGVPGPLASQERALVIQQVQAIQQIISTSQPAMQPGQPLNEDQILAILQNHAPQLPGTNPDQAQR